MVFVIVECHVLDAGKAMSGRCWHSGRGRGPGTSGTRLALRRQPVTARRKVRAQDELAIETACLETAMCLCDLIERDPLGDARPDSTSF